MKLVFIVLCALLILLAVGVNLLPKKPLDPYKIHEAVNAYRSSKGLSKLTYDEKVCEVSNKRLIETSTNWTHQNFIRTVDALLTHNGAGENLAKGQKSEKEIVNDWIESPSHNANLLKPEFTNTCISTLVNTKGETYTVQIYVSFLTN